MHTADQLHADELSGSRSRQQIVHATERVQGIGFRAMA